MRIRMRILSSSSKPISSPGRTEKFPPPLMRFLRSDVSSRSRGRSKASPLFFRRKKNVTTSTTGIEATQEPSSPKVTCIGQVRVRRSKINANKKRKSKNNRPKQRNYFNYIPSLCNFKGCYSPKWNCTWKWRWRWSWCWRWVLCFECFDCRRNGRVRTASSSRNGGSSSRFEEGKERRQEEQQEHGGRVIRGFGMRQFDDGDEDDGFDRGRRSSVSEINGTTPPRNAFLLTRSRSSSLASRFWGEEELVEETRRRSSASEMGPTMCITPPKNALLLTRSRSSSLGNRFGGEEEVEEIRRRSSASEMRTDAVIATTPPKNALVLTRSRSSSLANRFLGEGGGGDVTRRRSSASEMRIYSATTPPKNALVLTRSRSSSLGNRFCSEEGVEEVIRRKSSASEMRTLASRFWVEKEEEETTSSRTPGQEMRTLPSRFWVEKETSEMQTKLPKNSLLTRSRSLASRFWGEKKEEEEETRRKSSASEMSTQPKIISLLTRCRSSSLARRFWGEKEETKRRRSVSERSSTVSQTENAVVLTRCKSSSLAEIMLLKNRDLTAETRGNEGSNFSISEESKKSVEVCAEKDGEHGGACFGELLPSIGVKSNGEVNKVGGKNEERGFKLRRCKSEPARPDLPDSDSKPKNNESLRLGRFSNVETATYHLNNNNNNNN